MKDDTNITDFTAYRLEHLRNRRTDLGESMPIRLIKLWNPLSVSFFIFLKLSYINIIH